MTTIRVGFITERGDGREKMGEGISNGREESGSDRREQMEERREKGQQLGFAGFGGADEAGYKNSLHRQKLKR
jgi:hypothetical protein